MRIGLRERLLPVVTVGRPGGSRCPPSSSFWSATSTVSLTGEVHFYSVGFSAFAAAAAALGLTVVGRASLATRGRCWSGPPSP